MRKYLYIFKSELMSNLQYVSNILVGFIGCLIILFIQFKLWQYIYSDPNELINGYNMNQMVWYVVITEIIWMSVSGRKLCRKISNDVRSGNIAYNLNKPYSYVSYALFSHLGSTVIKFIIYGILATILGILLLGIPSIKILELLLVILCMIIAIVINTLLIIFIGLIAFFIEDANPIYWVYSKFILVIGTIFPIEFFPKAIQPLLSYSPIYAVCYGPAKLFVNFNINTLASVMIAQGIYLIISYILCLLIYKKGVKKLNVNGG